MLLERLRIGLRTKIIAWSFVPTAIILVAVALVTFYAYQQVTEDLVIGRNRELSRLSAGQLATEVAEYSTTLDTLARTSGIQSNDPSVQRAALKGARNRLVVFDAGVIILDSHGEVVAADPERPDAVGHDWSNRTYFRQVLRAGGPAFSDVVTDGPRGTEVIVVAVPITGPQGEFLGMMAGMFRLGASSLSAFYGDIVKLRIGESSGAYLVDRNGRVIYHSDAERIGSDLSAQPVVREVTSGKIGSIRTTDPSGQEIVASFAPVPGSPWGLVTQERWSALIAPSQGYSRLLLLLLALGVVVPAVVVTFGVRLITRPIAELIAAFQAVASGNFGQTITVTTGDELEKLAEQFNVMSAELQESYANLERRVADRTKELATLNAIAAVVSSSLDLNEVLNDALDKTMEIMAMEVGGAFRAAEDGQTLLLVAHRGVSEEFARSVSQLPLLGGMAEPAAAECQPTVRPVADLSEQEMRSPLEREGIRLLISVPLGAKGRVLGAIYLATRTSRSISREEHSMLAAIGQQVGVGVENARLYERAEQSAETAVRSRLARDLHDAVTQTLFSASLIAEVLPRLWERNPDEGRRRLEELRQLTRGALAEMRTLLLELRPSALVETWLGDLLRQLGEAITGRARVPIVLTIEGQRPLPPDVQVTLYRIAQEALNNLAKHAGASQASVTLRCRPNEIELCVSDDGRGFDLTGVSPEHLGLGIMHERAEAIGASLSIESYPGRGTKVAVVWRDTQSEEHTQSEGGE
ncbi:MAG: histidine kinase [Bacteroidetes bacterium]|nr:histidine kinase [Bacteroidota bacterium]